MATGVWLPCTGCGLVSRRRVSARLDGLRSGIRTGGVFLHEQPDALLSRLAAGGPLREQHFDNAEFTT